ncbi:MAG TPA: hypothetical protein VGP33_17470 [Chloroflexota bacterium]|jgi:hypothetical protein|nr:hypothetical protein [Chloroflexota bacterium]
MPGKARRQILRAALLAAILGLGPVALPVDAALGPTSSLPQVCGYLGVVNGTRRIDPAFAAGARPTSPPATAPTFGSGALLLTARAATRSAGVVTTGSASVAESNYCHSVPPLMPIGATEQ